MARVVDVPAEAIVGVAGEGDRVGDRVLAGDAVDLVGDLGDLRGSPSEEIAEEGPST